MSLLTDAATEMVVPFLPFFLMGVLHTGAAAAGWIEGLADALASTLKLVAGRIADRFGATRVSALWFALTAVGTFLLGIRMPLPITYIVVFLTGVWLFSAQTMVYAAVAGRFPTESRATALGWTAGMGRFGAVFGPWLGGVLLANHAQSWGFTVFAITAVFGSIMITLSGRGGRPSAPSVPSGRPGDAVAT
ncbi:MAG TPA: MFS transporter [Nonomuraea sp.]|nr:MFS transporter [Nonomuraea sp.]